MWVLVLAAAIGLVGAGWMVGFGVRRRSSATQGAGWVTGALALVLLVVALSRLG